MNARLTFAAVVLGGAALAGLVAPLFAAQAGIESASIDLAMRYAPPSLAHPLGTDELGRDVALRLALGARVSLAVGLCAALAASLVGTTIGLLAGYAGGRTDAFLMRTTDAVLSLPVLPVLIVLAAADPAKIGLPGGDAGGLVRIVVIVAAFGWPKVARLVRAATLSLAARDFVRAATALGASPLRVALVHILPNCAAPILVATALAVGGTILFESVLSFLGLGIQPPVPSWGNMLGGAQETIWQAPWLALWPGLSILAVVAATNLLADALQERFDPRRRVNAT
ncbi:MAG: ABC transporter permease subunit [Alphaproteobacteria bacterium]|nr:ABC transporter permease subunit [Alphaproteobacteria bacterium]